MRTIKYVLVALAVALSLAGVGSPRALAQHITPNHASAKLGVAHVAGDGQLQLLSGGTLFGTPSTNSPIRVVCVSNVGLAETVLAILDATGRNGNILTGVVSAGETYNGAVLADVNLPVNTTIECRLTDGLMAETRSKATANRGPAFYDVTAYGAAWNDDVNNFNVACANIVAAAKAAGYTAYTILVPGGGDGKAIKFADTYIFPFGHHVTIKGEARARSALKASSSYVGSPMAFAVCPNRGIALKNHWQAFAGADSSWNTRKGWRTCSIAGDGTDPAEILAQHSTLNLGTDGQGFGATSKLTLELMHQGYAVIGGVAQAAPPVPGARLGMAEPITGAPAPIFVVIEGGAGPVAGDIAATTTTVPLNGSALFGNCKILPTAGGWITFTSGQDAGTTAHFSSATVNGSDYVLAMDAALPHAPAAGDGVQVSLGASLYARCGDGKLNGAAGPPFDTTYGGTQYYAAFAWPSTTAANVVGPLRLATQLDLTASGKTNIATCAMSFNDATTAGQKAVAQAASNFPASTATASAYLQEQGWQQWWVGACGPLLGADAVPYPSITNAATLPGGHDWALGGFSLVGGLTYTIGTAGTSIAVNGSGPKAGTVNDSFRYGPGGGTTALLAYFAGDGNASDYTGGQLCHFTNQAGNFGAYVYQATGSTSFEQNDMGTVDELSIWGGSFVAYGAGGAAVEFGCGYDGTVGRVYTNGFRCSATNQPILYCEPINVRDLIADNPMDATVIGASAVWRIGDIHCSTIQRCALTFAGCDATIDYVRTGSFSAKGSWHTRMYPQGYAGNLRIKRINHDNESTPGPVIGFVDYTNAGAPFGELFVEHLIVGNLASTCDTIRLRNNGATKFVPCRIRHVVNNDGTSRGHAIVSVDEDTHLMLDVEDVRGDGESDFQGSLVPLASYATSGKFAGRFVVDAPGAAVVPTGGTWVAGMIRRNYSAPIHGTAVEALCTVGGTPGTWFPTVTP